MAAADAGVSPSVDAARSVFEKAGLAPSDVQVAQLQDTDSGAEIYHMAETGLCEHGAQQELLDLNETAPTGRLPINTDGGCLANGEPVGASGLRQVREVVLQLQGRAGARQVANDPRIGFTHVYGAPGISACTVLTTRRLAMAEPDLEQWRAEVRAWLASVLPPRGAGGDAHADYAVFHNITEDEERAVLDKVRAYRRERYDAGYGALALPAELGGAGLSMRFVIAFTAEEQSFDVAAVDRADQCHDRSGRPDDRDLRHRRPAREVRPRVPALGPAVLPAVQRAGCRLRSRRSRHDRGAAGRRLAHQRPEGLVVGRTFRRLRLVADPHRSRRRQAGRPDDVPRADGRTRCSRCGRSSR